MMFDLNGLIDMDLFYKYYNHDSGNKAYSFLLNYIIGNVFYNSPLYTRQRVLGTSFYFTTSYEIYNLTGIYSIHFDEIDDENLSLFNNVFNEYGDLSCSLFDLKRIGNVVLSGSLKMLSLYENPISFLNRYSASFQPKFNLISIGNEMLEGIDNQSFKDLLYMESNLNFDDITLNDFLAPYIICENKLLYLSSLPSIIPIIKTDRYHLFMELLTSSNYRLNII